jgi:hypothetical protein
MLLFALIKSQLYVIIAGLIRWSNFGAHVALVGCLG